MTENRNGPERELEAVPRSTTSTTRTTPDPTDTPRIPHLTAVQIAESRPLYLLIVKTPTERVTRRTYLSLPAAEKACRRAQDRGSAATLELHRVVPYTVGAELHGLKAVTA